MGIYDRRRARRSIFQTVSWRAASQISTAISYVVLVRSLPKSDFAILSLLYAFIPVVSTVASLGLEQTLRRYQPEYLRAGGSAAAAWLTRFVAVARLLTNLAILSLLLTLWKHLAPIFGLGPFRMQFALFSLLILLFFQVQILQLSCASHMLQGVSAGSIALISVLKLLAYTALATHGSLTLRSAIIADTISYAAAYAFLQLAYRRYCLPAADAGPYRPDSRERRRLITYGALNNFNDAGTLLLDSRTDNFFIAALLSPLSVAAYSFYNRLTEMLGNCLPIRLFENVLQPLFFSIGAADSRQIVPRYFTFLLNMNLAFQWPVLTFVIAYHSEIVRAVFGGKYLEHAWMLPLVVGFATLNLFANPVTLVAQYKERPGIILLSKAFGGLNVVALLALIPYAGLYGAAIASGTSQLIKNLFIWWQVRDLAVWQNLVGALSAGGLLWGAAASVCILLRRAWAAPDAVQLLLGGLICAVTLLVHLRGRAIARTDRELLARLFHGREARLLRRLGLVPDHASPLAMPARLAD